MLGQDAADDLAALDLRLDLDRPGIGIAEPEIDIELGDCGVLTGRHVARGKTVAVPFQNLQTRKECCVVQRR